MAMRQARPWTGRNARPAAGRQATVHLREAPVGGLDDLRLRGRVHLQDVVERYPPGHGHLFAKPRTNVFLVKPSR
jgi:hypothetical protein